MGDAHGTAGHEIDKMPNRRLFFLLVGLSALTLAAAIGVIQVFNMQLEGIENKRANDGAFSLRAYKDEMAEIAAGHGKYELKEFDGKASVRYHIPVSEARKKVLEDPKLLKAQARYPGWDKTDTAEKIQQEGGTAKPGSKKIPARAPTGVKPQGAPAKKEGKAG